MPLRTFARHPGGIGIEGDTFAFAQDIYSSRDTNGSPLRNANLTSALSSFAHDLPW